MLSTLSSHYNYYIVIILMMLGLYAVFSSGNMVKRLVGLGMFQASVFLFYISIGKVLGGQPPILPEKTHGHDEGHGDEGHGGGHADDHAPHTATLPDEHGAPPSAHHDGAGDAGVVGLSDTSSAISDDALDDGAGSAMEPGDQNAGDAGASALVETDPSASDPSDAARSDSALNDSGGGDAMDISIATQPGPVGENAAQAVPHDGLDHGSVEAPHADPGGSLEVLYSNPLPHVLILTAIVVGVATLAVGLALVVRIRETYGSIEEEDINLADHAADTREAQA